MQFSLGIDRIGTNLYVDSRLDLTRSESIAIETIRKEALQVRDPPVETKCFVFQKGSNRFVIWLCAIGCGLCIV